MSEEISFVVLKLKNPNFTNAKAQCKSFQEDVLEENIPLCIMLPKMTAYRKTFDKNKYMFYLIKDNELLKKYNKIWDKVSNVRI